MDITGDITGLQKAAVLLTEIGLDSSVDILRNFNQRFVPRLMREVKNAKALPEEVRQEIIMQFLEEAAEIAGTNREAFADELLKRTLESTQFAALEFLQSTDRAQLVDLIKEEHPQVGAFILAYLNPKLGSTVLGGLPRELQADLALRVAAMRQPNTEALEVLDKVLATRLNTVSKGPVKVGGIANLVQILRNAGRNSETVVMEALVDRRPDLVEQTKKMLIVFEDLTRLDDRSFQKIVKQIDGKTLALALKKTTKDIEDLVMRNLSERVREMLVADIEALGKVRLKDVMEAQQKIVECFRELERTGEIVLLDVEEEMI